MGSEDLQKRVSCGGCLGVDEAAPCLGKAMPKVLREAHGLSCAPLHCCGWRRELFWRPGSSAESCFWNAGMAVAEFEKSLRERASSEEGSFASKLNVIHGIRCINFLGGLVQEACFLRHSVRADSCKAFLLNSDFADNSPDWR